MGRRDFSQFSVKQEVAWLSYLMEIVVQHKSLQSRGFVLLANNSNATRKQYTSQSEQYLQRALDGAFPIRMRSSHICNAAPLVKYVLFPVARRLAPKNMRLRVRLHRDSGENLLRSLETFNLPKDRVPSDLGGSVMLNIKQFVLDRISLEVSRAGINLQPSETDNVDQSNRTGTTLSSAAQDRNALGQAPPIDAQSAAVSRGTTASSKRKGPRNIVDPRMKRAVRAKQDDPDLSLYDALTSGGFAFAQKGSGTKDSDFVDEDDVSLKQRKNNLCRRLREEKRKDEEKAIKTGDDGTASVAQNQASAAAMARHDSFDEEIQGLPGCPDDDKEAASILMHFKHGT